MTLDWDRFERAMMIVYMASQMTTRGVKPLNVDRWNLAVVAPERRVCGVWMEGVHMRRLS